MDALLIQTQELLSEIQKELEKYNVGTENRKKMQAYADRVETELTNMLIIDDAKKLYGIDISATDLEQDDNSFDLSNMPEWDMTPFDDNSFDLSDMPEFDMTPFDDSDPMYDEPKFD